LELRKEKEMSEFTDRIRMEIVPELEARLTLTQKAICKNNVFTRDYKAGVKDNLLCGVEILNSILDDFDKAESACDLDN
jgi:hypothetical protein